MDEILRRIERLDELSAEELTQLGADINAAYDAARDPDDGEVEYAELEALRDARKAVTDRQADLAATEEANLARLADLDAEMAAANGEPPAGEEADLTELEGLSAEELEGLAAFTDDDRQFFAELAEIEGLTVEDIEALNAEPPPAADAPPPADEQTPAQRAAAAARNFRLPPTGRRTRQPVDAQTPAPTARRYGHVDGPGLDGDAIGRELMRAAAALGRSVGREDRIITIPLGDDIPRLPDGRDVDISGMLDSQLQDLRAHRAAAASQGDRRVAAGELCAPARTDYEVLFLGSDDMPMAGLFPTLGENEADAMKTLNFTPALDFSDFADIDPDTGAGIDSATATQNASSANYPKTAVQVDCPPTDSCEQRAAWLYLIFDNLNAMAWPEFNSATNEGGRSIFARHLERLLLQDWFDHATAEGNVLTPFPQPYNANHSLLYTILAVVSADRADTRGGTDAPYVVAAPSHLAAQLATEVGAYFGIGNPNINEAVLELIRRAGVTINFYLDGFGLTADARLTDGNFLTQMEPVVGSGVVPSFPCEARLGIARDDAGFVRRGSELNLGVTRLESDLEDNTYRTFFETWQRLCFRSRHVFVADVEVAPNALVAGQVVVGGAAPQLCAQGS